MPSLGTLTNLLSNLPDCPPPQIVFYGVYPVFDATGTYSVTVPQTCSGAVLEAASYGFWYWASDIYGRQTKLVITSLSLSSS